MKLTETKLTSFFKGFFNLANELKGISLSDTYGNMLSVIKIQKWISSVWEDGYETGYNQAFKEWYQTKNKKE